LFSVTNANGPTTFDCAAHMPEPEDGIHVMECNVNEKMLRDIWQDTQTESTTSNANRAWKNVKPVGNVAHFLTSTCTVTQVSTLKKHSLVI